VKKMNSISPLINKVEWGVIDVNGLGVFQDVKLYPGGGREWNWRETNTHHDPGIQIADIDELLSHGADNIVLSRGMLGRLKIAQNTMEYLKSKSINIYIAETNEAVARYNKLARDSKAVGGLFHSTC
jgi:hypothetical protein